MKPSRCCLALALGRAVAGVAAGRVLGQAVHSANDTEAIDKLRDRDLQPGRVMDVIGRRLCE